MEPDVASIDLPPMARFAVVLFLVLCIPYITRRLRLPSVVGYILAGVLVGPHGISLLPKHAQTAEFFAELGKLLLMFFAGLEVDMRLFRENRRKSLIFGLATFGLPFAAGLAAGLSFGYGPISAILVGSLLASHTLIAYPIVIAAGLARRPAIAITVGATILTDILSLLVLAVCVTTHVSGFSPRSLALQIGELALFVAVMVGIVGPVGRWLFERLGKSDELSFTLMMAIVAAGATFAEALQLEGILGAFLAGLAVNEAVRGTAAKEKIEFLGNTVFIPAFFIVTGFLVDLRVFAVTLWSNTALVLAIVLGLIAAKWIAAEIAGRAWGFSAVDRGLMGSLTLPQVAATLASALVGYQAVNGAGQRLVDDAMLNTVLVLVIVTSVLGPILVEYFVRRAGAGERSSSAVASVPGQSPVRDSGS
ncbi:MAG: cation:proton antiporter [Reyranella sp.]|uniref:cation:proton antiporter n=1 Tax=Reyranella sp. TaxID=1929291 RepID=UPI001AC2E876|nr:cation:proton antiporter [Reyranella sp.]MBN9086371.1 cation:proton antiporter [Reyranella sp.]